MKKIFTLFAAFILIAVAAQYSAQSIASVPKPIVCPNPAHDYIKANWQMNTCDMVTITLLNMNGTVARTFNNHQYCDGFYTEAYKLAGIPRGSYVLKIKIGNEVWYYKMLIQ